MGCRKCCVDPRDLEVTPNAYFSLSKHTKQLSLVKSCDKPAEIEVSFRTHGTGTGTGTGWTDGRGSQNSYLDIIGLLYGDTLNTAILELKGQ